METQRQAMVFNAAPKKKRNMVWATEEWIPVLPLIGVTSRNGKNRTLRPIERRGGAGTRPVQLACSATSYGPKHCR